MTITELINKLEELKSKYGDINIIATDGYKQFWLDNFSKEFKIPIIDNIQSKSYIGNYDKNHFFKDVEKIILLKFFE